MQADELHVRLEIKAFLVADKRELTVSGHCGNIGPLAFKAVCPEKIEFSEHLVLKMLEIPGKGLCQYLIADIEDVLHVRHFKIARDREIFKICSHIAAVENVLVQRFKTSTHYFSV